MQEFGNVELMLSFMKSMWTCGYDDQSLETDDSAGTKLTVEEEGLRESFGQGMSAGEGFEESNDQCGPVMCCGEEKPFHL